MGLVTTMRPAGCANARIVNKMETATSRKVFTEPLEPERQIIFFILGVLMTAKSKATFD